MPLFALANAGVHLSAGFLSTAYSSPVTLGIMFGYVLGKPIGIVGATWLATELSRGRLRPPVGWASVAGAGTIAGIGFTVSILIADLAFHGAELDEAKVGVLSAALLAATLTWLLVLVTKRLPRRQRIRALLGTPDLIVDLADPVDPERDHIRGPLDAPVTVLEYGDFECPYCGQAEPVVRELLREHGDVAYVWRHLPLNDVHPSAQQAAEAAEAAASQGAFWEMHDLLLEHQDALGFRDLVGYAEAAGARRRALRGGPADARRCAAASRRTSTRPISRASRARRRSSSTACATTAPTTSRRCRRRSRPRERASSCGLLPELDATLARAGVPECPEACSPWLTNERRA